MVVGRTSKTKICLIGVLGQPAPGDDGEATMAVEVQGAALLGNPLYVGLPIGEPLVRNWSRVKHLLEGWSLPQTWGRMETPEAAELALHQTEDCLELLSGRGVPGIVGSLFIQIVESVIEERERLRQKRDALQHHLEELGNDFWDALKEEN